MRTNYVVVDENGEVKKPSWKERLSDKLHDASQWIRDNQELTAILASLTITGLSCVAKITNDISKTVRTANDRKVTERRVYDPREGHYWVLKRELSNREWLEIQTRENYGERLGDILANMRVLKK